MLESKVASDVTFKVGDPSQGSCEIVEAHRYMLLSRSPVFFAMFCGGMKESDITNRNVIEIPDTSPQVFKAMLK